MPQESLRRYLPCQFQESACIKLSRDRSFFSKRKCDISVVSYQMGHPLHVTMQTLRDNSHRSPVDIKRATRTSSRQSLISAADDDRSPELVVTPASEGRLVSSHGSTQDFFRFIAVIYKPRSDETLRLLLMLRTEKSPRESEDGWRRAVMSESVRFWDCSENVLLCY